ncbi:MAG: protein kinase [Pirellulaceae bacterium]
MFKPGFQFAPGYRIEKFLGRGQFGQVWQVSAPGGTSAAVKFIDLADRSSQKEYEGIKRVKQIRQANLMPITAIWQLDEFGKAIGLDLDQGTQNVSSGSDAARIAQDSAQETMDQVPLTDLSFAESFQSSIVSDISHDDQSRYRATATFDALPEPAWLAVGMLLGGKCLRGVMKEFQKKGEAGIPFDELISYMQDAAKGLDFLNQPQHDLGNGPISIQHCDIKPANIVTIGNSAMICDFGLAKILSRNQASATSAAGTPAYMAPEAIAGKPSNTSDQYSLAITYCELRTGTMPVEGSSVWEVIDKHREGRLNFATVPEAEREVLRKATHLDWQSRYESCSEMVDALRDAYRGIKPVVPAGFGFPSKADGPATRPLLPSMDETTDFSMLGDGKQTKQRRGLIAGVAAIGVVGLAALSYFAFADSDARKTTDMPSTGESTTTPAVAPTAPASNDKPLERASLLAEAIALVGSDENAALAIFQQLVNSDPNAASQDTITVPGSDPLQAIWIANGNRVVTLGHEPSPQLFRLPTAATDPLPSQIMMKRSGEGSVYPQAIAFDTNRNRIAAGGAGPVSIWTLESNALAPTLEPIEMPRKNGESLALAWHPVESILVSANDSGVFDVWDVGSSGSNRHAQFHTTWIGAELASDPHGKWLVVRTEAGDVQAMRWNDVIDSFDITQTPKSHSVKSAGTEARVMSIVSVHGQSAVAVGSQEGSVSIWKLDDEPELINRIDGPHQGSVEAIRTTLGKRGTTIVSCGSDGVVKVWQIDEQTSAVVSQACGAEPLSALALATDQRWVVTGGYGAAWLWDWTADHKVLCELPVGQSTVTGIVIDPSGQWIVAACDDGKVRLWDLRLAKLHALNRRSAELRKETTPS